MLPPRPADAAHRTRPRRSRGSTVPALLALAVLATSSSAQPGRADVDINRENDYYAAAGANPLKVVEQYHLGPCEKNLNAGNYRKAVAECEFILRIFPNHPQALHLTVRACDRWKSPECRLDQTFERAIAINPKVPATFVLHGIYLHGAKQYAKARQSYERALALDADSMNAHYNLGLTCIELGDYACANEHAQRAYALGSTLPGLRDRLQKAGQWKPAAAKQSQLRGLSPEHGRPDHFG